MLILPIFRTMISRMLRSLRAVNIRSWRLWVWVALYAALLVFVIIPFLRYNQLLQWDAPGHIDSAWYIKKYLWPWPVGWNPFFFTGFPQGTFYPPLFHYLVAALSFIVPLVPSAKIIVSLSILATPLAFYRYVRALRFSHAASTTAMLLMTALIIFPFSYASNNNAIGGTLYSTFNVGLLTNGFILPIVFFYFAALHSRVTRGRTLIASLLLSAIVLTHVYAAIAAVLYVVLFAARYRKSRSDLMAIGRHIGLSLLLTAWWWVPFLLYQRFTATIGLPLVLGSVSFITLAAGILASLWLVYQHRVGRTIVPIEFLLVMTFGLLMINVVHWPVHTYRLVLYPFLMIPILAVHILAQRRWRIALGIVALAAIGYGFSRVEQTPGFSVRGPQQNAQQQPIHGSLKDRVMILSGITEQFNPHINQLTWPIRTGDEVAKGLFVESSITARYLLPLESLIDPTSFIWGIPVAQFHEMTDSQIASIATKRLKEFGMSSLVSARSLARYGWTRDRLMTDYTITERQYDVTFGQEHYAVPMSTSASYFATSKEKLFLVVSDNATTTFQMFNLPPRLGEQSVLRTGQTTFFIRRVYADLYDIDFMLASSQALLNAPDGLQPLQKYSASLPPDQQAKYQKTLDGLAGQITQQNAAQAQVAYANIAHETLSLLQSKQVRNAEVTIGLAPRTYRFYLYNFPVVPLVIPLKVPPEAVAKNWQTNVDQWFYNETANNILIHTKEKLPTLVTATVKDLVVNTKQTKLSFTISATHPAPVEIHISYFPRWRAYQDGKRIALYQASPNSMVVYGQGKIELRYVTPWDEAAANILSVLTVVLVAGWAVRWARQNRNTRA